MSPAQVRLVEDDVTYSTFAEVYELNCARYGREADLPIAKFKEDLNQAIASQVSGVLPYPSPTLPLPYPA